MFNNVRKILIFKLCCFGDTVFIVPAIKSFKANFPEAKIIYANSKWTESLMDYIPFIDGSMIYEHVYSKNPFKKIMGSLRFIWKVRKEKFDMVFFGHRSNILSLIIRMCSIKYRIGFRNTKFLTHTAIFRSELPEPRRYLHVLSENGLMTVDSPPELKAISRSKIRETLGLRPDNKLLGVYPMGGTNPGTVMHIKRWGMENYLKFISMVNTELPQMKIIIFAGKMNDEKISLPPGINAVTYKIDNDLISACDYFVSGDTGSLHIAAAMGVSTLAIFGPSDPRILAPMNTPDSSVKHAYIWKMPACSPCYTTDTAFDRKNPKYWTNHNFICNTGTHVCIKSIAPEEVLDEFKKLISN